jgi:hypothetical protein
MTHKNQINHCNINLLTIIIGDVRFESLSVFAFLLSVTVSCLMIRVSVPWLRGLTWLSCSFENSSEAEVKEEIAN